MDERNWSKEPPLAPEEAPRKLTPLSDEFQSAVDAAREELAHLHRLRLPKLFVGLRWLWLYLVLLVGIGSAVFFLVEPDQLGVATSQNNSTWVGISSAAGGAAGLLILTLVYGISVMQASGVLKRLYVEVVAAGFYHQQWAAAADRELQRRRKEYETQQQKMERQLNEQIKRFDAAHQTTLTEIEERRQRELREIESRFNDQTNAISQRRTEELAREDGAHQQQVAAAVQEYETKRGELQASLDDYLTGRRRARQAACDQLRSDWDDRFDAVVAAESDMQQVNRETFPDWETLSSDKWEPPTGIPAGLRLGHFGFDLAMLEGGLPKQQTLVPQQRLFRFPAVLPFPSGASLLLKTADPESRRAALQAMQVNLLRMLTLLPPGKLRLTIFDPVGLGESFSGLMHLADYDELLITSRIWTETSHFEARLADLTEHMENVLQKYLRNEFSTIEAYNEFAGEVAEPYHVLVIADFPNKFSEQAARRLTSVAVSGPRCGVYLIMSTDPSQPTPHGFDLADVEAAATSLSWQVPNVGRRSNHQPESPAEEEFDGTSQLAVELAGEAPQGGSSVGEFSEQADGSLSIRYGDRPAFYLEADDSALCRWPIVLDDPPSPETFTQIVKTVGEASKDVRRVEVSFGRVAPPPDDLWSRDSRGGIDVPLGRAGAMKLQHLKLGKGTSQHMLVAGKTGSGKSTFFHALVTNAALYYSPHELEFYLVDFKKGVEFKAYTKGKLPHARVIAIESDREFGISVLQRLDAVLHERGELFREEGVQDVAAYRDAQPQACLPRIMLVIDEFQEFFVEDDRYSQQAALLLDRLVRQGRAFGIHVILGSQTLGGAYSLARSTLGQVAVRVALQCSESDAHLILSESNTAARLLTRPGEAIYNDSNGAVEGNHPFQIAWLPDEEREGYLGVMQHFVQERRLEQVPPIVFEGNIPSDPAGNSELTALLGASGEFASGSPPWLAPRIWLGDAVEIGPPTFVEFPQQAGSNLLIIGQDPTAAAGVLATGYLALAAQLARPSTPAAVESRAEQLWILDGSHAGSQDAESWKQLASVNPEATRIATPGTLRQALTDLTAELERREQDTESDAAAARPPMFVIVGSLSRFRDLRKAEDDFGFGGFGAADAEKPVDPAKQFADLIARGPEQGIHVMAWVDSAGNLDRWTNRQLLKEFELRVVFAMNPGDSSNLIDSPAAAKLGPHRALLYREETGTTTKFRPYGPPAEAWLNRARQHVSSRQQLESAMDLDGFEVI